MNQSSLLQFYQDELADSPIGFGQVRVMFGPPEELLSAVNLLRTLRPQLRIFDTTDFDQEELTEEQETAGGTLLLNCDEPHFQELFEAIMSWKDTILNRENSGGNMEKFRLFVFLDANIHQAHSGEIIKFADSQININE
jgi:hypothetical protein